jgi:hypothetical protein
MNLMAEAARADFGILLLKEDVNGEADQHGTRS